MIRGIFALAFVLRSPYCQVSSYRFSIKGRGKETGHFERTAHMNYCWRYDSSSQWSITRPSDVAARAMNYCRVESRNSSLRMQQSKNGQEVLSSDDTTGGSWRPSISATYENDSQQFKQDKVVVNKDCPPQAEGNVEAYDNRNDNEDSEVATYQSKPNSSGGGVRDRLRNMKERAKSIVSKPISQAAPMPQAIAALIRDAAQMAVENALQDIVLPALQQQQESRGRQQNNDEDNFDDNDSDSRDFELQQVIVAAEKAAEDAVAASAGAVAMEKAVDDLVDSANETFSLASEAKKGAERASNQSAQALETATVAYEKATSALNAVEALQRNFSDVVGRTKEKDAIDKGKDKDTSVKRSRSRIKEDSFSAITNEEEGGTKGVGSSVDIENLTYDDVDYSLSEMAPPFLNENLCLVPGEAIARIEKAPQNSRRIFAGIDIMADVDDVWKILTEYDGLQKVVPNLVTNEVVRLYHSKQSNNSSPSVIHSEILNDSALTPEEQCRLISERLEGARLKQVGGAKVIGINFSARTTLDVREWPDGLPDFAHYGDEVYEGKSREKRATDEKGLPLKRYRFPRPFAICTLPHKDISMQNIDNDDGEFRMYQGVWRMQPLPGCAPADGSAMRLTYAVEISPRPYLPVGLIEGRITRDLCANLKAIRDYVTPPEQA